ncbi:MAG: AAA family ATPase, partial [Ruminococcus sp.]|nr:AAA family ATPase [Ruminococcus sp.]
MKNTRVIAVANQKGGVGKTTSVVNIGTALSMKGYRVLLIDLDTQESLSNFFGVYSADNNIADLMSKCIKHEKYLYADYIVHNEKNQIDLIPSELNTMNALEKDLILVRSRETV